MGTVRNSVHQLRGCAMLIALILLLVSIVLAIVTRAATAELLALWAIGAALILPHVRDLL